MGNIVLGRVFEGEIVVFDVKPKNGVFNKGETVAIRSPEGVIITDREKVDIALRKLGIDHLPRGTKLNPLQHYTTQLQEAIIQAGNGEVAAMEMLIDSARQYAQKAGIELDEGYIARLTRGGFLRAYRHSLEMAKYGVREGVDSISVEFWIERAYELSEKAGVDHVSVESIRGHVYDQ